MKKLFAGAAVAAMAVFGLTGCESRNERGAETDLQEAQRELGEVQGRQYDSVEERNAAVREAQQDVREEARELQEDRNRGAWGGAHDEGVELRDPNEPNEPVDATDLSTQELEHAEPK